MLQKSFYIFRHNFIKMLETKRSFCYNIKYLYTICNMYTGGMIMRYVPKGVCSKAIDIDIQDGIIQSVSFTGGCNGNLQGISSLVKGMPAKEAISRLKGIKCGFKPTSCPDQLAQALESIMQNC